MALFRIINRVVSRYHRQTSTEICRRPVPSNKPLSSFGIVPSYSTSIPPPPKSPLRRALLSVVKFGSLATLGTTGFLAYLSYAYTIKELAVKADSFRQFAYAHPAPLFSRIYRGGSDVVVPGDRVQSTEFRHNTVGLPVALESNSPPFSTPMAVAALAIDMYLAMLLLLEQYVKENYKPLPDKLLPDMHPVKHKSRVYTLVLDLNETLVHSDWKGTTRDPKHSISWISGKCSCEGEGLAFKRPGLDAFLEHVLRMGYEVVLYTDESSLDVSLFQLRLKDGFYFPFLLTKEHTKCQDGKRYRDLSRLNRDPSRILYVSGHALENCLQPESCVPIKPWKKEVDDTTLTDLLPFLEYIAYKRPYDIRPVLSSFKGKDVGIEFIERSKSQQRGMLGWWRRTHTRG